MSLDGPVQCRPERSDVALADEQLIGTEQPDGPPIGAGDDGGKTTRHGEDIVRRVVAMEREELHTQRLPTFPPISAGGEQSVGDLAQ